MTIPARIASALLLCLLSHGPAAAERASAEELLRQGRAHAAAGRLDRAEKAFRKAARLAPADAEPLVELGLLHRKAKRLERAADALRKAWALRPKDVGIARLLAQTHQGLGQFEEASEVYRVAAEICPECADVYIQLGYARLDQGRDEQALEAFRSAAEIKPEESKAFHHLAAFFMRRGQFAEAEELFLRSLSIAEAHDPAPRHWVGRTLQDISFLYKDWGKPEKIRPHYARALELVEESPGDASVLNFASAVAEAMGRAEDAQRLIERALAVPDKDDGAAGVACVRLGGLLSRRGLAREAAESYRRALGYLEKKGPALTYVQALMGLAEAHVRLGEPEAAEAWYEKVTVFLAGAPDNPQFAKAREKLAALRRERGRRPK